MTLNRAIIGKALEDAGITGEQRKKAEGNLLRAIEPERQRMEPWKFPVYTMKPNGKIKIPPPKQ